MAAYDLDALVFPQTTEPIPELFSGDFVSQTTVSAMAIGPVTHVNSKALSLQGYLLAKSGRTADARRVLSTLEPTAGTAYLPPYAIALVHAGLGEREAALRRLEQGLDVHDVHLAALPADPKWDSFRQDARFAAIVERCGFTRQRP